MKIKEIRGRRYIQADITQMALRIQSREQKRLCFIAIMKGGLFTAYNLYRYLRFEDDSIFGHLGLKSYGDGTKPRPLKITYPLDLSAKDMMGRNVWLIDDIYDTGATMQFADDLLDQYDIESLNSAVLVYKKRDSSPPLSVGEFGFCYEEDDFLVGCGMGIGEEYRYLRYLAKIEK